MKKGGGGADNLFRNLNSNLYFLMKEWTHIRKVRGLNYFPYNIRYIDKNTRNISDHSRLVHQCLPARPPQVYQSVPLQSSVIDHWSLKPIVSDSPSQNCSECITSINQNIYQGMKGNELKYNGIIMYLWKTAHQLKFHLRTKRGPNFVFFVSDVIAFPAASNTSSTACPILCWFWDSISSGSIFI